MVAEVHGPGHPMAVPWRLFGVLISAGCLLPMSYFSFGMAVRFAPGQRSVGGLVALGSLAAVAGLVIVLALWRLRGSGTPWAGWRERLRDLAFPLALVAFMTGLAGWVLALAPLVEAPGYRLGWSDDVWLLWVVPALLANVAILGLAAWLVRVGVRDGLFYQRVRKHRSEPAAQAPAAPSFAALGVEAVAGWLQRNQARVLIATGALQVVVLVGKTVVLRVVPVDPRDLMRGDYVILSYEASRVPIDGDPPHGVSPNTPVYVILEPEEDGQHWHAVKATLSRPWEGTYLAGRTDGRGVRFGIEAYYVREGTGRELEIARNRGRLSAEVAVAPWGQAALRRLIVE